MPLPKTLQKNSRSGLRRKSPTKKTHYHRALLDNLFDLYRDRFAKEAEEFIREREGYGLYKFSLVKYYIDHQQLELGREHLNQWKEEFPLGWLQISKPIYCFNKA